MSPPTGFRLLGTVEAYAAGHRIDLGYPRQRLVLAVLLADAGRLVTTEALIDRVWGQSPPEKARRSLYTYIARIRACLAGMEPAVELLRRSGGYLLRVEPELVDLHRFHRLVRASDEATTLAEQERLLARALALWQGEPLTGHDGDWVNVTRTAWQQHCLSAEIRWAQLALLAGRPEEAADRLTLLADRYPLSEPLAGSLMRALVAAGRGAEALAHYASMRTRLAEELGAEPGPELRELHLDILRAGDRDDGDVYRSTPATLPPDVAGFIGRRTELAWLDGLVSGTAERHAAVVVVAVSGCAGVGKTALAVHWAHAAADRFPDGQLYVDLRGFDPGGQALGPATAVRQFLDVLGVSPARIPADLDGQVGLYRSVLRRRRVLIVADNARDAAQVRPLLPAGPGSMVLVTSRNELPGLVAADGAYPLALDVLGAEEATRMLTRRLGEHRLAAEPDAAAEIIARCGRLPLALAIAAARAATQPRRSLATLAAELRDSGGALAALRTYNDPYTDVRTVFSWSYEALRPAAARLFRLLGLAPGPQVCTAAAASLAALPAESAAASLAELTSANLLVESAPGRYSLHNLLAAYARDLAIRTDNERDRHAATVRLLDYYLHSADAADRLLSPARDPILLPLTLPAPGTVPDRPADVPEAMRWFAAEYTAVLAAQALAATTNLDTYAWQLGWTVFTYLWRRGHITDLAHAWRTAAGAADRLADPSAAAHAQCEAGAAETWLARYDVAESHLRRALDLHTQAADQVGQARTHLAMSILDEQRERIEDALNHGREALALFRAAGHQRGSAQALNSTGWLYGLLGDHAQGLAHCREAVSLLGEVGDPYCEAVAWDSVGYIHHQLGEYDHAADCYDYALGLMRRLGSQYDEALILEHLGDTRLASGALPAARAAWVESVEILTTLEHHGAADVRTKLAAI